MDEKQSKLLWDAIRKEKDLEKAVQMAADVGESAVNASIRDREGIKVQLNELKKILSGNGDPSHSLISRLDNLEEDVACCKNDIREMISLLRGDMKGGESLVDRIRQQEKVIANLTKMGWLVLSVVLTEMAIRIINLF